MSSRSLWVAFLADLRTVLNGDDADAASEAVDRLRQLLLDDDGQLRPPADLGHLGGSIAGPGGPYSVGDVVIDTSNAVLLDACEVAVVGGVRGGVLDPKPITALVLRGRVNKSDRRAEVLYLLNEDGAAGIVTELVAVAQRAGWGQEFVDVVLARLERMP